MHIYSPFWWQRHDCYCCHLILLFLGVCLWPSRAMIPAKEEECAFMLLRQPVGMGPSALL